MDDRKTTHDAENFECFYLTDKPKRDLARKKIHDKILTVDDVIKKTYDAFEAFQKEMKSSDILQDGHIEELKAMMQEMVTTGSETDEEIRNLKKQINKISEDIMNLREHLDNGYTQKLSSEITDRLFSLIETISSKNFSVAKTEQEFKAEIERAKTERKKMIIMKTLEILGTAIASGGIIYLIVGKF